jgi:hypothetical protein
MAQIPKPIGDSKLFVLVVFAMILYLIVLIVTLALGHSFSSFALEPPMIFHHFPAIVGLPMAAALAFLIVILLPQTYGNIEFKALGVTFKGAAGPVVLWLVCFLGISAAVRVFWSIGGP